MEQTRWITVAARVACLHLALHIAAASACESDPSAQLYTVPPSCADLGEVAACNASLSLCTNNLLMNATAVNCSSGAVLCSIDFVRCVNAALLALDLNSPVCSWAVTARVELLLAAASADNSSALSDSSAVTSCRAIACGSVNRSCGGSFSVNTSERCLAALADLGMFVRPLPSATLSHGAGSRTLSPTQTPPMLSVTQTEPTSAIQRPSSDESPWQRDIVALNESVTAVVHFVTSLLASSELHIMLPLPAGCPPFLAAFATQNRTALEVYSALSSFARNSTNSTLQALVTLGETTVQVSFQPALFLATYLDLEYNGEADFALHRAVEALRVLELALNATSASQARCVRTPAPQTSHPPTTRIPTAAPTSPAPTSPAPTTAEPTEVPTIAPPTSMLPNLENQTLAPTEQLMFRATIRNSLTYPYIENDLVNAVRALLGIASNQLQLITLTTNITVGVLVDVQFTFLGADVAALQSATLALTSAQLSAIGIITLQSAPVEAATQAPSILFRSSSLIWVGGAGLVGAVALIGGAYYCVSERRRQHRQLERARAAMMCEDPGDGLEINLLPHPSKHHHAV